MSFKRLCGCVWSLEYFVHSQAILTYTYLKQRKKTLSNKYVSYVIVSTGSTDSDFPLTVNHATSGNVCIILNGKRKEVNVFWGLGPLMTLPEAVLHTFTGVVIKSSFLKNPIPIWFSLGPDPLSLAITCIWRSRLVLPG